MGSYVVRGYAIAFAACPRGLCRCCSGKGVTTLSLVSRSFWPAHQDSVTTLHFLQDTAEEPTQPHTGNTQALEPYWELKTLGTVGPQLLAEDARAMLTPINQQHCSLGPPGSPPAPSAPPQRRSRKQLNPHQGAEKVDPQFEGVTLKFQIKPDSSLQIIPSYR